LGWAKYKESIDRARALARARRVVAPPMCSVIHNLVHNVVK